MKLIRWLRGVRAAWRERRLHILGIGVSLLAGLMLLGLGALNVYTIVTASPTLLAPHAQPTPTPIAIPNYHAGGKREYAQDACTPVYASTSTSSLEITQLMGGSDVTALGAQSGWTHVAIWSGVKGYIPSNTLDVQPPTTPVQGDCQYGTVASPQPNILPENPGPFPAHASGVVLQPTSLYTQPNATSIPEGGLGAHQTINITGWASDHNGYLWYETQTAAGQGWVWADDVRIAAPPPATTTVHGQPLWKLVAGKGMWFTNYLTRHTDMPTLIRAAKLAGVTHLYVEVAITQYGFFAPDSLDRILPAAHAAGIPVIAWVYPTLDNVGDDVRMTQEVANYRTPSGDRADGLVTDVETTVDALSVYTYGQMLRALLGPDELLVDSALNPIASPNYPYAAVAASWNVIAPMDYWHGRPNLPYSAADVRSFVTNNIATIRNAITQGGERLVPIEETGQMYDMYSNDGTDGGDSPNAAEITADMQTAHDLGCIAVSFFEWQTASQPEWAAFDAYHWQ